MVFIVVYLLDNRIIYIDRVFTDLVLAYKYLDTKDKTHFRLCQMRVTKSLEEQEND